MSQTAVNKNLAALLAAGVSPWLDQIRRDIIEEGELARMVAEDSLRGVTSNPAIFEKAILGADLYDDQIRELALQGADNRELYQAIAIQDVQSACDILRPVWDETDGYDGYVSLEVDPDLADVTDRTIEQAKEYWSRVDRPNLMIKIPGTDAGVPAITEVIAAGINVNVTLLFAVESYENIARAYIEGLKRRHAEGESVDVHSVASFFVSRVDSEVDKRLKALDAPEELLGIAGLANARAAYQRFKEIFLGEEFAELKAAGAPVQRPLWASTGVKDPRYPDTLYVDGLVAPDTVNTMPTDTYTAAGDHGSVEGGATADQDPTEDLKKLEDAGIDLTDVTKVLLKEAIDKFVTPMEALLTGIEAKRQVAVTKRPDDLGGGLPADLVDAVKAKVEQTDGLVDRIWGEDDTVWGEAGQAEVSDRLGWLDIADRLAAEADDLRAFAKEVAEEGLTDVVLLGMGGSSLAPEVLRRSFGTTEGFLKLTVLDSTDAAAVQAVVEGTNPDTTLYLVSTKSGGTIETLSAFETFWASKPDGKHFAAITDPGSPLLAIAEKHGFRRTFENDPNIGGRYSALSYFGLVPAALIGADLDGLLHAATTTGERLHEASPDQNAGLWLGAALGALAAEGRDKLTFVVDEPVPSFGLWVEQLVAESTGKEGKGILPVADEPLRLNGEGYGEDRVFVHLRNGESPVKERDEAIAKLQDAGHPVVVLEIAGDPTDLGRLFLLWEFAIAVAGWALGINPFDQPNVAEAKDATKEVLKGVQDDGNLPDAEDADDAALAKLLDGAGPPHYVAVMAYVHGSDEVDLAVAELRTALQERTGSATTFGYGPRFLHSTGQLHKGGPATGRFLQIVSHVEPDVHIPETTYGFEVLKAAQALGDLNTLKAHDLPAARVTLPPDDLAGGVKRLADRIRGL